MNTFRFCLVAGPLLALACATGVEIEDRVIVAPLIAADAGQGAAGSAAASGGAGAAGGGGAMAMGGSAGGSRSGGAGAGQGGGGPMGGAGMGMGGGGGAMMSSPPDAGPLGGMGGAGGMPAAAGAGGMPAGGAAGSEVQALEFAPEACDFSDLTGCEDVSCEACTSGAAGTFPLTQCTTMLECLAGLTPAQILECVSQEDPICGERAGNVVKECTMVAENQGFYNGNPQAGVPCALDLVACLCTPGRL